MKCRHVCEHRPAVTEEQVAAGLVPAWMLCAVMTRVERSGMLHSFTAEQLFWWEQHKLLNEPRKEEL